MIITGLHIPTSLKKRLSTAVAGIHRETAAITLADLRKRARAWDGCDGSHLCAFHVTFTPKGAVKSLNARLLMKPREEFSRHRFEVEVPLFGGAELAARKVMRALSDFLIWGEIEHRKEHGFREMIDWQNDELQDATRMGYWTPAEILLTSQKCGTVSEVLRARVAEHEVACRKDESNHARLDAISKNEAFLNMCRKSLADERAAAEQWSEKQKAEGRPISTRYAFDDRSEEDRTVIAYRDMKGW